MDNFKSLFPLLGSALGGGICAAFGGWDTGIIALLVVMALDFLIGTIALLFFGTHRSADKVETGWQAIYRDFFRKFGMLCCVIICHFLELHFKTNILRDSAVIFFIGFELVAFADNMAAIGIPLPESLKNTLEVLRKKPAKKEDKKITQK